MSCLSELRIVLETLFRNPTWHTLLNTLGANCLTRCFSEQHAFISQQSAWLIAIPFIVELRQLLSELPVGLYCRDL